MVQIANPEYNDFDRKFKFYIFMLNPLGLWPSKKKFNHISCLNLLKIFVAFFLMWFSIIPNILKIVIEVKDPAIKLNMFGSLSFFIMSMVQYVLLLGNLKTLYRCIDDIRNTWNETTVEKEQNSMLKFYKTGMFHLIRSVILIYTGSFIFFTILPFMTKFFAADGTLTRDFAYPTYSKIFDPKDLTTFRIVYVVQWLGGYVVFTISTSPCALVAIFLTNISAHLDILMQKIDHFVTTFIESNMNNQMVFASIFSQHSKSLR